MPLPPPIFEWNYTSARLYEAEVLPAPPHDRYAATFETAQSLRPLSALPDAGLILRASNFLLRIFFLLCLSLAFLASASPPMMTVLFFTVAHNGSISVLTPSSNKNPHLRTGRVSIHNPLPVVLPLRGLPVSGLLPLCFVQPRLVVLGQLRHERGGQSLDGGVV